MAASLVAPAPLGSEPAVLQHAVHAGAPRIENRSFVSFDGARLELRTWPVRDREPWAVIVALHGFNDHSKAFHLAGPWWARHGVTTYAYDQRGFGRSPGRGEWAGEAAMTEDLRTFVALVRARHPRAVIAVAGESMGGAVAIRAFASDRPPAADKLILLAPALYGWSAQPPHYRAALVLAANVMGSAPLRPPRTLAEQRLATDNAAEMRRMAHDPLMIPTTRPATLRGLVDLMEGASQSVEAVEAPVALFYGRQDRFVPLNAFHEAAADLDARDWVIAYPKGWHLLLRDRQARVVYQDVLKFVAAPNERPPVADAPAGGAPPRAAPGPTRAGAGATQGD